MLKKTLIVIEILLLFIYVFPFLAYHNLYSVDMATHLFWTEYYSTYLWPHFSGWNPYFFGGFPQGTFYPPLFHWIAGGLGKLVGVRLGFKILVSLMILATPFSFVYFLKKLKLNDSEASYSLMCMVLVMAAGLSAFGYAGGDFANTLSAGFMGNGLGIVLLFFYLGSLLSNNKIVTSILFVLTILSHIYVGLVAFLCFMIYLFYKLIDERKIAYCLIVYLFISFLLLSFWLFPFLAKKEFMSTPPRFTENNPDFMLFFFIAIFAFLGFWKEKRMRLPILFSLPIILSFLFASIILHHLPLQLWRFPLYLFLFLSSILGLPLSKLAWLKTDVLKKLFPIFLPFAIILVAIFYTLTGPGSEGVCNMQLPLPSLDGRVITTITNDTSGGEWDYILNRQIPSALVAFSNNEEIAGLLISSTPSANYINYIRLEVSNKSWVDESDFSSFQVNSALLGSHFKYFAVNYILTNIKYENLSEGVRENIFERKVFDTKSRCGILNLYYSGNNSTFEILNYKPEKVTGVWHTTGKEWNETEQWKWFIDPERVQRLITPDELPNWVGEGNEILTVVEKQNEYIKLYVNASHSVPIHVKIPYFPNWHAYVNGESTEIYKVPINMMLIYGQGVVELKYEPTISDQIGVVLTFIGIGYVVFASRKGIAKFGKSVQHMIRNWKIS